MSFNSVTLVGRLGQDVELKETRTGKFVANLSIATSEYEGSNSDGSPKYGTAWHTAVVWGKTAEACKTYLTKGDNVLVHGHLTYNIWEKDGVKRKDARVMVDKVEFLGGAKSRTEANDAPPSAEEQTQAETSSSDDDDLPF